MVLFWNAHLPIIYTDTSTSLVSTYTERSRKFCGSWSDKKWTASGGRLWLVQTQKVCTIHFIEDKCGKWRQNFPTCPDHIVQIQMFDSLSRVELEFDLILLFLYDLSHILFMVLTVNTCNLTVKCICVCTEALWLVESSFSIQFEAETSHSETKWKCCFTSSNKF